MAFHFLRSMLPGLGVTVLLALVSCGGKVVVDGSGTAGAASLAPTCSVNDVGFGGEIGGVPLLDTVALTATFATEDRYGARTDGDGLFVIPSQPTAPAAPASRLGFVRIPAPPPSDDSPSPSRKGEWLCDPVTPLAAITLGLPAASLSAPVTLSTLRRFGTCPGTPISGQIVCQGDTCDLGEIGGTMTGASPDPSLMIFSEGGIFVALGAESGGVVLLPRDHPDAEALYCVGSVVGDGNKVTMGALSRLGTCAEAKPIDGAISLCEGALQ